MKVSRAQMILHRNRILEAASRMFRSRGFERSGVAEIMNAAGMTHGGFYGHFASKSTLAAEACSAALTTASARWGALIDESPDKALEAILDGYLSDRHRDSPATGCALAALATEAAREDGAVRSAFTGAVERRIELLAKLARGTPAARREEAIATLAGMVGAIVLARVVDDASLSDAILDATSNHFSA